MPVTSDYPLNAISIDIQCNEKLLITSKHPPRRTNGMEQIVITTRRTIRMTPVGFA